MPSLEKLCQRMEYWCNEANLGYDQSRRWDIRVGGECDCSSLVYWCLWEAGFLTKPTGNLNNYTLYTGSIRKHLKEAGWVERPVNGKPKRGMILLNDGKHVAVALSATRMAQASIDENGRARGGKSGDQSGRETNISNYRNYPWSTYLEYTGKSDVVVSAPKPTTGTDDIPVDGYWGFLTTQRAQTVLGTPVDGYVDGQDEGFDRTNRGGLVLGSSWRKGKGGSDMVQAIQKLVGANPDRLVGPDTITKLQKRLGTTQDGYVDGPSEMVKALQRRLNQGKI